MEPVAIIETQSELISLVSELSQCGSFALDTESNSFHAYFEKICLIQVSTEAGDYIVDPLALGDISPLRSVLDDPGIEKILHAASNDILGLRRDFGFTVANLFDTSVACGLLGYRRLGLARTLERFFDISLSKKLQRYDWSRRPLTKDQIEYARLDTHYLIELRALLARDLQEKELFDTAKEAFEKICGRQAQERLFRPSGFIRISGAQTLDQAGKRILKALYMFRENEARRLDRAPFRVLSNEALVRLACERPKSLEDFSKIKGLPKNLNRVGAARNLLELIRKNDSAGEGVRARE